MNISEFSSSQQKIITTLDGPLFVAAGAGSGKTFTLKLRTAHAFQVADPQIRLDSINQVLAITFTDKAAAELLSRIKDTLFQEGLTQQAFECEQAWISTIHGFCSRLLRENALEIGLDSDFKMISELQARGLQSAARNAVIKKTMTGEIDLSQVEWNWDLVGSGSFDWGMLEESEALASRTSALPNGFGALKNVAPGYTPIEAVQKLIGVASAVVEYFNSLPSLQKKELEKFDALLDAISTAKDWLAQNADASYGFAAFDKASFLGILNSFPHLSATFGGKYEDKGDTEVFSAYKQLHAEVMFDAIAAFGAQAVEVELELAKAYEAEYARLKKKEGLLDNNDLLSLTVNALREHPALAEKCRQQFRLIMVDEFQDTDKIQTEILSYISQPGFSNVCVVGDAQQSIYRFRGADVNSFFDYKQLLKDSYPQLSASEFEQQCAPKLDDNYRSHADILKFVDKIFSQDCSFKQDGIDYLQLHPKGKENAKVDPVFGERERVYLDITHYESGNEGKYKELAYRESAARIAEHFATLKKSLRGCWHY